MTCFRFEGYLLDPRDRQLRRDGAPVELNARYFDALALLVREAGRLVSKDRFLDEVWHGVPVTDEALTQCIRTLRKQLGDDAASPRFIETVPKHGYRFIAPVERIGDEPGARPDATAGPAPEPARLCRGGSFSCSAGPGRSEPLVAGLDRRPDLRTGGGVAAAAAGHRRRARCCSSWSASLCRSR